jgi:hypothetical protein
MVEIQTGLQDYSNFKGMQLKEWLRMQRRKRSLREKEKFRKALQYLYHSVQKSQLLFLYIYIYIYIYILDQPGQRVGFQILTGLFELIFLKKSKRHHFSKKTIKKNHQVAFEFLIGSCRVTPGFSFPCFFFNLARFQPQVSGQPVGRAGFYPRITLLKKIFYF